MKLTTVYRLRRLSRRLFPGWRKCGLILSEEADCLVIGGGLGQKPIPDNPATHVRFYPDATVQLGRFHEGFEPWEALAPAVRLDPKVLKEPESSQEHRANPMAANYYGNETDRGRLYIGQFYPGEGQAVLRCGGTEVVFGFTTMHNVRIGVDGRSFHLQTQREMADAWKSVAAEAAKGRTGW